jgi:subtilase family serine protease
MRAVLRHRTEQGDFIMRRLATGVLLVAAMVLGASSAGFAQTVLQSHGVYNIKACPGTPAAGAANCTARVVTNSAGKVLTYTASKAAPPPGYGATQLRAAYKITAAGSSATTVAIVDAYGYPNAEADLGVYRSQMGLPACTTANGCFKKVGENGGAAPSGINVGWATETALDLDMVSAMCPGCKILLVEATTNFFSDFYVAENYAASQHVHAISNSYSTAPGQEAATQGIEQGYDHPGIAITVSTGDDGTGAAFPADSPHVISVGGTTLQPAANPRGWSEVAWSDGGGGCSKVYGKPVWQHDTLCTMRTEADTSAVADPATGVAVYAPLSATSSAWQIYGGTSVAAPLVAGVYGNNGGSVPNFASTLYAAPSVDFNDVTLGSDGACSGTYFCTAGPGYDGPTGLGTPNSPAAY